MQNTLTWLDMYLMSSTADRPFSSKADENDCLTLAEHIRMEAKVTPWVIGQLRSGISRHRPMGRKPLNSAWRARWGNRDAVTASAMASIPSAHSIERFWSVAMDATTKSKACPILPDPVPHTFPNPGRSAIV